MKLHAVEIAYIAQKDLHAWVVHGNRQDGRKNRFLRERRYAVIVHFVLEEFQGIVQQGKHEVGGVLQYLPRTAKNLVVRQSTDESGHALDVDIRAIGNYGQGRP